MVFLSVFEHNANLIPWRETGAEIVLIPMTENGDFDYESLSNELCRYTNYNSLKVGSFIAASNVTGTLFDVDRIAVMCHKAGFLACFDYAASGPYVDINMNGPSKLPAKVQESFKKLTVEEQQLAYKDSIFLSPHKMIGGPGTSGILLARERILASSRPYRLGGAIVFFVNETEHEFVADKQEREESGTPGILQDVRTGLVFQLKEAVSATTIMERDEQIMDKVLPRLMAIENMFLLGNNKLPKVPIFSFVIKSKNGKILHSNFVTQLLSDLFGIQSRSGCQCSAMYGQKILGIDLKLSREYKEALMNGQELLRMGFTRINFAYFLTEKDIEYMLKALEFVSEYGWLFLPHYKFDEDKGTWTNRDELEQKQRAWLGEIDYSSGFI